MTLCPLCLCERDLVVSHIIPGFLYGPIRNEKNQLLQLTGFGKGHRIVQDGFKQPLLCGDCDGKLNSWYEQPFQRQWTDRYPFPETAAPGSVFKCQFDYQTFKLFHLSIFFRAGVSSLPAFSDVRLGRYQERMRKMLLQQDAGKASRFPLVGLPFVNDDNEFMRGLVFATSSSRIEGHRVYGMMYDSVLWGISVSDFRHPRFERLGLHEDGSIGFAVTRASDHTAFHLAADMLKNPRP